MPKFFRKIAIAIAVLVAIYFIAATIMVFTPEPSFSIPITSEDLNSVGFLPAQTVEFEEINFTMRDGETLFARRFASESDLTILFIHGVASDSRFLNQSAGLLRDATDAEIITLDLRGHGESGGESGNVDYIGQYEDDIADVISSIRETNPDQQIILAGHSMGGAIVLRFARIEDKPPVDAYLLFAPNLGIDAPTGRTEAPETTETETSGLEADAFLKLHVPRLIGITMFKLMGFNLFDHMPTMYLNLPSEYTNIYSYGAMVNSTPEDYQASLEAIDQTLLVLVGTADEAMIAENFEPLIADYTEGELVLIEGETHDGIYTNPEAMQAIQTWVTDNL